MPMPRGLKNTTMKLKLESTATPWP